MIDRNNYQEYMLLYLDGELSSTEREAVELFLEQHTDLQEEFMLLQQAVLQPEQEVVFQSKESLYKKENGITVSNYQEYFLLYIDNELGASEKEMVETFVLQQPQLQEEFTLLKETVLPAERISFVNKQSLYRKEAGGRPVIISMRWASLAAAVMIGVMVLVMFANKGGKDEGTQVVAGKNTTRPSVGNENRPVKEVIPEPAGAATNDHSTIAADLNNSTRNIKTPQPLRQQSENGVQEIIEGSDRVEEQQLAVTTTIPNPGTTHVTGTVTTPTVDTEPGEEKVIATSSTTTSQFVQPAVYSEPLEQEEDKTVYLGAVQVNPDKVRGFFRKATRFFTNKVKSNDDDGSKGKVRVANIEMNKIK